MLECPPCGAVDDGHEEGDQADEAAEEDERSGKEQISLAAVGVCVVVRMSGHPVKGADHEDGEDEGDEREVAEADAQEHSEAVHGGSFHGGAGRQGFG